MYAIEAKNSELRSKVSHIEHAPNNLTNTSNQLLVLLTWQLNIKYGPCHRYKMPLLLR
ncbi:hypothetical protein CsSME_00014677 [Camellia sinensis var. sinensis]